MRSIRSRRLPIVLVVAVALALAAAAPASAAVQGPPYDGQDAGGTDYPDVLFQGFASHTVGADKGTGRVTLTTQAETVSPAGIFDMSLTGYSLGASRTNAGGRVVHRFPVTAGLYRVTVVFDQMTYSATASHDYQYVPFVTGAISELKAAFRASFYPCPAFSVCQEAGRGERQETVYQRASWGQGIVWGSQIILDVTLSASVAGHIFVDAGLYGSSSAQGRSRTALTASGRIASITVA